MGRGEGGKVGSHLKQGDEGIRENGAKEGSGEREGKERRRENQQRFKHVCVTGTELGNK